MRRFWPSAKAKLIIHRPTKSCDLGALRGWHPSIYMIGSLSVSSLQERFCFIREVLGQTCIGCPSMAFHTLLSRDSRGDGAKLAISVLGHGLVGVNFKELVHVQASRVRSSSLCWQYVVWPRAFVAISNASLLANKQRPVVL